MAEARKSALAQRLAVHKDRLLQAFPKNVRLSLEAQDAFIDAVTKAIDAYGAATTQGDKPRRTHRRRKHPRTAHRPDDSQRHSLIGDLFDAYMSTRKDDIEARGFKQVADAVLRVARIDLSITDNDRVQLKEQRCPFVSYVEREWSEDKHGK